MAILSSERNFTTRESPMSIKLILNNYTMDYKTRLSQLNFLPLMYVLELHDVLFLSLNPGVGGIFFPFFGPFSVIPYCLLGQLQFLGFQFQFSRLG